MEKLLMVHKFMKTYWTFSLKSELKFLWSQTHTYTQTSEKMRYADSNAQSFECDYVKNKAENIRDSGVHSWCFHLLTFVKYIHCYEFEKIF